MYCNILYNRTNMNEHLIEWNDFGIDRLVLETDSYDPQHPNIAACVMLLPQGQIKTADLERMLSGEGFATLTSPLGNRERALLMSQLRNLFVSCFSLEAQNLGLMTGSDTDKRVVETHTEEIESAVRAVMHNAKMQREQSVSEKTA